MVRSSPAAFAEFLTETLGKDVLPEAVSVSPQGEAIAVVDVRHLVKAMYFLRDNANCQFRQLVDVTAVDYPERARRFEVIYQLLSVHYNLRLRVKVHLPERERIASISEIFRSAIWLEREVWDMYGIRFDNHPDHRRILTDYGFEGHPLRKDFPLTGYVEVRYDLEKKKVVYEPVQLQQDFRSFDFLSPWEGTQYVLPGDEKAAAAPAAPAAGGKS